MPKAAQDNSGLELHWYRGWSLALLGLAVIILSMSVYLVFSAKQKPILPVLSQVGLEYKSEKASVKVGQSIILEVYFTGEKASEVFIADIRPIYDKSKLSLVKANEGTYFKGPITKFDNSKGYYVLASEPNAKSLKNKENTVITFEFKALKPGITEVGFGKDSLVFITGSKDGTVKGLPVSIEVTK